jgi:hypothetical protein
MIQSPSYQGIIHWRAFPTIKCVWIRTDSEKKRNCQHAPLRSCKMQRITIIIISCRHRHSKFVQHSKGWHITLTGVLCVNVRVFVNVCVNVRVFVNVSVSILHTIIARNTVNYSECQETLLQHKRHHHRSSWEHAHFCCAEHWQPHDESC